MGLRGGYTHPAARQHPRHCGRPAGPRWAQLPVPARCHTAPWRLPPEHPPAGPRAPPARPPPGTPGTGHVPRTRMRSPGRSSGSSCGRNRESPPSHSRVSAPSLWYSASQNWRRPYRGGAAGARRRSMPGSGAGTPGATCARAPTCGFRSGRVRRARRSGRKHGAEWRRGGGRRCCGGHGGSGGRRCWSPATPRWWPPASAWPRAASTSGSYAGCPVSAGARPGPALPGAAPGNGGAGPGGRGAVRGQGRLGPGVGGGGGARPGAARGAGMPRAGGRACPGPAGDSIPRAGGEGRAGPPGRGRGGHWGSWVWAAGEEPVLTAGQGGTGPGWRVRRWVSPPSPPDPA